jgi:probable O-glycosylation ligase (exosortase A-associated)
LVAALGIVVALSIMPDKWFDRIKSIQNFEQDWSSMDRIKMWRYGFNVAIARPLTGGGFGVFPETDLYPRFGLELCGPEWYLLPPTTNCVIKGRSAHSIYFDMIGEHGFIGFGLFVILGLTGLVVGQGIISRSAGRKDLAWAGNLADMSQVSMVAFLIGGLFVNMTYFDLYYNILVFLAATHLVVVRALAGDERKLQHAQPRETRPAG